MMSAFFVFLPCILLSGFIFPIDNMPNWIQWFTYLNPLRYFLIIVRGIFLKGIGTEILWPQMLALTVLGCALLFLASRRFRKTMA
jgi:ABC-2 type transport system permease protein